MAWKALAKPAGRAKDLLGEEIKEVRAQLEIVNKNNIGHVSKNVGSNIYICNSVPSINIHMIPKSTIK